MFDLEQATPAILAAVAQGHAVVLPDAALEQAPPAPWTTVDARGTERNLAVYLQARGGLVQRPLVFRCCQLRIVAVIDIPTHMAAGFQPTAVAERFLMVDQHGPASDHADEVRGDIYPLPGTPLEVLVGTPFAARRCAA